MQPEFVTKPAFTVVGMLIHTSPMAPEIPQLWGKFGPRMDEVQHQAEPGASYGLMDHFDFEMSKMDYLAGCSVEKVADLPDGMASWEIPANNYAVFQATLPTIDQSFDQIFNTWLPTSDYQLGSGPQFEYYSETFSPDDPASTIMIYIPVKKV